MSRSGDTDDTTADPSGGERARWLSPASTAPDLASLRGELARQLAAERGPIAFLRARATTTRLALLAGTLVLLGSLTLQLWMRADLALYPGTRMIASLLVMGALFLCAALFALWPLAWPRLPDQVLTGVRLLVPLLLAALYALPPAHEAHPASLQPEGGAALLERALYCLSFGGAHTLALTALLFVFDRGGARRGALIALAGSVASNLLLQLHCPITASAHLWLGHLGIVLLAPAAHALLTALSRRARVFDRRTSGR